MKCTAMFVHFPDCISYSSWSEIWECLKNKYTNMTIQEIQGGWDMTEWST